MRYLQSVFSLLLILCLSTSAQAQNTYPSQYDVVIRNGRIIDGSGNPWYEADVGIVADRIVRIGNLS